MNLRYPLLRAAVLDALAEVGIQWRLKRTRPA